MPEPTDIHALLARGGRDDIAIAAPEREPLTYGGLRDQVGRTGDALARAGIGPGDRVAIVLRNGPEMAAAFLGAPRTPRRRRSTPPTVWTSSPSTSKTCAPRR